MIPRYRVLARRIEIELAALDNTQQVARRHWQRSLIQETDRDAFFNSVALNLHSFYSGLERIFELIANELDGGVLGGSGWHSELLQQMTLDLKDIRPPVLESSTAAQLDEYRKFRHRIRNIYAGDLDASRMQILVEKLPLLWELLQQELGAFVRFLEGIANSDESSVIFPDD